MRDRGGDEGRLAEGVAGVFWKQQQLAEEEDEDWSLLPLFVGVMFGLLLDICWGKVQDEAEVELPDMLFGNVSAWASSYSYHLVKGINEFTRSQLAMVMREYIEKGQTFGELRMAITEIFGPDRAARIAVTEVTRAYTEAQRAYADHLATLGSTMTEIWRTDNDKLVCDICAPRNGKKLGDGWMRSDGPPSHPNCRCRVDFEAA